MTSRFRTAIVSVALLASGREGVAQDVISGKFYRFQVVGRAGLGTVSGTLAAGPSINSNGQVAFGGQSIGLNALYVSDLGASTPRRIVTENQFSLSRGIQINNAQHVVALDQSHPPNGAATAMATFATTTYRVQALPIQGLRLPARSTRQSITIRAEFRGRAEQLRPSGIQRAAI